MLAASREGRMSRIIVLLAGFLVLAAPGPSRAAFHVANIDEIMSGVGGDASAQYVEIRMLSGGQTFVAHSRLTAFSCDGSIVSVLLEVPANICNSAPTHDRWTMGTASWATV